MRERILTNAINLDVDVVPRDHSLLANRDDLDLNIHNPQTLRADVDVDETGVDGLVELPEARDESDGACIGRSVKVEHQVKGQRRHEGSPWFTFRYGFGHGTHGKAPHSPTTEPRALIIVP